MTSLMDITKEEGRKIFEREVLEPWRKLMKESEKRRVRNLDSIKKDKDFYKIYRNY